MIARSFGIGNGARVPRAARSVHFASRNARKPDVGPLGTPNGAVAIPYGGWGAVKRLACGDDGDGK